MAATFNPQECGTCIEAEAVRALGSAIGPALRVCLTGLALLALGAAATAQVAGGQIDENTSVLPMQGAPAPKVVVERSRSADANLPQLASDGRTTNEFSGVGYRWWSSHGRADIGVGVGTIGRVVLPPAGQAAAAATLTGSVPMMTVGWRYRVSNGSAVYADASRAALAGADEPVQYNAKVGMEWRSAKPDRLGFEPGSLGVQFDSGYRMSLRLRSGGVKMVLKSQF